MSDKVKLQDKTFKVMIPANDIDKAIENVARELDARYQGKTPVFLGVLSGSFLFLSDLVRKINFDNRLAFVKLSSYEGTQSTGVVKQELGVDFDIEIVEKHHNKKLDAPSGTALMIANAVADEREESEYIYDRHSVRKAREPKEIGIHSVRGGSIVGEHEVIFAGANEVVSISHSAASREIFANGALRAAIYLAGKSAGLYSMTDLIEGK